MSRSGPSGFFFSQDAVAGTEQRVPITDRVGAQASLSLCASHRPLMGAQAPTEGSPRAYAVAFLTGEILLLCAYVT